MNLREVKALIFKEFLYEWKQKNAFVGVLIYVISTVFLTYFSFKRLISTETYNALFWIIILFTGVNTISRSFMQENEERQFYYYQLVSPQGIILSKMLYNSLVMLVLTFLALGVYITFLGNPIVNISLFLVTVLLGSTGLAVILSMVSAIASKTGNNPTIMAILSFPIILPFLDALIGLSLHAINGIDSPQNIKFIIVLGGMNAIVTALSYLLFPYLWRD